MPFDGTEISALAKVLVQARDALTPETWFNPNHTEKWVDGTHHCAATAIEKFTKGNEALRFRSLDAVRRYMERGRCIMHWNDAKERTLEEVHAAFDQAIAREIGHVNQH